MEDLEVCQPQAFKSSSTLILHIAYKYPSKKTIAYLNKHQRRTAKTVPKTEAFRVFSSFCMC